MRLILSGGGTGGHIIPNIALIHELRENYAPNELLYIGSKNGMESKMIPETGVQFAGIDCGKLRRYFSWENFVDFFRIPLGILQARKIIKNFKPDVIFCKGGYVCFPVALAGWLCRVPVVLHESDVIPGLTNKLSTFFAKKICVAFEESKKYFPVEKVVVTGNPIRRELAFADDKKGLAFLEFKNKKPILLFMGGSSGASFINELVWRNLDKLVSHYQIVHICGEGKVKTSEELLEILPKAHHDFLENYRAFGFINHELKDVYAASNAIITRSGAIALAEIHYFQKPACLIPLSKMASRGDQIVNAQIFAKNNPAIVLEEDGFDDQVFLEAVKKLVKKSGQNMEQHRHNKALEATDAIINLLQTI